MFKKDLKKNIPDAPGVYFFKIGEEILYVGKATSLKNRINSYFAKDILEKRGPLIAALIEEADNVEVEETDSVLESVILEAKYIKQFQPKYNTKDKSQKSFYYLVITNEEFPRVFTLRERELLKKEGLNILDQFGPFPSGTQLNEALKIVRKIFPFRDKGSHERFYKQLGLSPDVSDQKARQEYKKNIKNIRMLFSGQKKKLIKELEKEMSTLAKKQEFEKAEKTKKQIFSLNHVQDIALIKKEKQLYTSPTRIEAYDIAHMSGKDVVGVMVVVLSGEVKKSEYRKFILRGNYGNNDIANLKEILLRRLKHTEWPEPDIVVVDGGLAQLRAGQSVFDKIPVVSVTKNEKHKPEKIKGSSSIIRIYKKDILLANNEAHRFAIKFYRQKSGKLD